MENRIQHYGHGQRRPINRPRSRLAPSFYPPNPKTSVQISTPSQATYRVPLRLPPRDCICNRPKKMVMCRICGFTFHGRVRKLCIVHPKTIFLMDIDQCPGCHAYSHMIHEYSDEEIPQ